MITEKRATELLLAVKADPKELHAMVRLIRLGFWAKNKAYAVLSSTELHWTCSDVSKKRATEALDLCPETGASILELDDNPQRSVELREG